MLPLSSLMKKFKVGSGFLNLVRARNLYLVQHTHTHTYDFLRGGLNLTLGFLNLPRARNLTS
jgi:hypothetical protein